MCFIPESTGRQATVVVYTDYPSTPGLSATNSIWPCFVRSSHWTCCGSMLPVEYVAENRHQALKLDSCPAEKFSCPVAACNTALGQSSSCLGGGVVDRRGGVAGLLTGRDVCLA